jgi:acetyl-CoA carboxylase biotin carboxylase subunit
VEHPITEWCTGVDLVREMVRVAAGEPLGYSQADVQRRGASIECRVYAENPASGFLPSPGTIEGLRVPAGPYVRDDGGVYQGAAVPAEYDPRISKLSVWGPNREAALARMRRALREYVVTGISTNLSFHERLLQHPRFIAGDYDTGFVGDERSALVDPPAVDGKEARDLSVALALAVARRQQHASATHASGGAHGLSPWLQGHRTRKLRD